MAIDRLQRCLDYYDVVIIGSGLGGLTAANFLAKEGHSVLLLEHHYQYGGLATWFRRKHKHIFDISLHGFPYGMVKSCIRYWTPDIAGMIEPIKELRFINPQYDVRTTFQRSDFTNILEKEFDVNREKIDAFYDYVEKLGFEDDMEMTTGELLEVFFSGRHDVHRLLMEPIAYANGSTLEDPAVTYAIVFSNFMKRGVYIFKGGADKVIGKMVEEAQKNGVEMRKFCEVECVLVEEGVDGMKLKGVVVNGKEIGCASVISNANLKNTVFKLVGKEFLPQNFCKKAEQVRLNSSSCQVYMGIEEGKEIPYVGDLIFSSKSEIFSSEELLKKGSTSRAFSFYYSDMRPENEVGRYAIVASMNARWSDWAELTKEEYKLEKEKMCEATLEDLESFIPGVREKINWVEASTPRTVERFTKHMEGTTFGTKYEGLAVSMRLPEVIQGMYHAGSVGIIMSGWLGTINYGVITANKVAGFLKRKLETVA